MYNELFKRQNDGVSWDRRIFSAWRAFGSYQLFVRGEDENVSGFVADTVISVDGYRRIVEYK